MNHQQSVALRNFAFSLLGNLPTYIAGGFATDYEKASDVDLWVLGDPMLEAATAFMEETGVKWAPGKTSEMVQSLGATVDVDAHATAIIKTPLIPIHVVGTRAQNIDQLLRSFDISTHRWAISKRGALIEGPEATSPYEPGRVLVYKFKDSTDARVKKLEKRYDIEITHPAAA
jgi:hypothetical protein